MPRRSGRIPVRSPWWNDDCDLVVHELKRARGAYRHRVRGQLRGAVRSAKSNFADKVIKGTDAAPERVWELISWSSGRRRRATPPIRSANGFAIDPEEQGATFAAHFFPREATPVNPTLPDDPPAHPTRAFVPITMDEARDALRETSNTTAPGESGSTYRL
ncbi:hypothetical protein FB107DRAFT_211657, partial [Schizophyllum commune]